MSSANTETNITASARKKRGLGKVAFRIILCIATFLLIVTAGAYRALTMVHYGPYEAARNIFTASVMETSAAKFLATWFLSDEVIAEIIGSEDTEAYTPPTRVDAIEVWKADESEQASETAAASDTQDIEIIDIMGRTYTGKLMIVRDPSRVTVGVPAGGYGTDKRGETTLNMVKLSNSLAGVNGGGFDDYSGHGNGGVPIGRQESGIVIRDGKLLWGSLGRRYEVIGLNADGVLVLGTMTAQEALDMGITEALNFGPYLILDGTPNDIIGESESGLNPRTAIGQRKDGAILLLVINGRQSNSLGATFEDLIEIFMQYEAVNAANLDGGSSSYMVYEDEIITVCASLYGPRRMATSVLVSRGGE